MHSPLRLQKRADVPHYLHLLLPLLGVVAALVFCAIGLQGNAGDTISQIERAAVIRAAALLFKVDVEVAEGLVRAELVLVGQGTVGVAAAVAGQVGAATPQAYFIEVHVLQLIAAEYRAADAAVAHGQGLGFHGILGLLDGQVGGVAGILGPGQGNGADYGRLFVPEIILGRGRGIFICMRSTTESGQKEQMVFSHSENQINSTWREMHPMVRVSPS